MTLDQVVKEQVREVVREEIRAALRELGAGLADELLTYAQAGKFVGCSVRTITSWVASGALPRKTRGRICRVLRSDVLKALSSEQRAVRASPEAKGLELLGRAGLRSVR